MEAPLALFITWTVYGTHLPGALSSWRHRSKGNQTKRPLLDSWHHNRLKHQVILLNQSMRCVTEDAIEEICHVRAWQLWALSARSNYVHTVVSAPQRKPTLVRDQLKAKASMELRRFFPVWKDRPLWTAKGDIEFLDNENEIERCAIYVSEAQDRKSPDLPE